VIAFLIIVLAAGLLIMAVISASGSKRSSRSRMRTGSIDKEFVSRKWATVQAMSVGNGANLRDAVSEADKLLDYALKQFGVPGETMGDRLKRSGRRFNDINAIWRAHKLRNALAHEVDFDLVPAQAKEALNDFEQGLRDLGAL
jgi:hypothetical protein